MATGFALQPAGAGARRSSPPVAARPLRIASNGVACPIRLWLSNISWIRNLLAHSAEALCADRSVGRDVGTNHHGSKNPGK
jgi:hypothetical protein